MKRHIKEIRAARRHDVAGIYTRLSLSGTVEDMLDPFLVLAHHGPHDFPPDSAEPSFDPHPHRGFETVTFILDGDLWHRDSDGNESLIHAGGVQWLTAGSGVVHSERAPERFWKEGGTFQVLQLWVNLPARLKMTPPNYQGVEASALATVPLQDGSGTVTLISGEFAGAIGPVASLTDLFMSTVSLKAGGHASLPTPRQRCVLLYVVNGEVTVGDATAVAGDLVTFEDGDFINVEALGEALIIFGHGDPIGEPVVTGGSFVMNTEAEITAANNDYRAGKFGGLRSAGLPV